MEDTDKMIDEQPVPNKKDETNNMNETKNSVDEITKDENTKTISNIMQHEQGKYTNV